MGKKLVSYYEKANSMGGLKARMRLAMLTGIPSAIVEEEPDSPDNIQKFEKALNELKKEFK